jgi:hypothetical protein
MSSQFIVFAIRILSQSLEMYPRNCKIHGVNTRNKLQLRKPQTNHTKYHKGAYYENVKIVNKFPEYIAESVLRENFYIKF